MAEQVDAGSLPTQSILYSQSSILDLLFFPGFTRISTAVQQYLTFDLSVYIPLLCTFGLLAFTCKHACEYLWQWFGTYFTSTVYVKYTDEAYDMLLVWISSQSFASQARSSLASTDIASHWYRPNRRSNDHHSAKKPLHYTPWNGRFFFWYNGYPLVFRRVQQPGSSTQEEVSISCFGGSLKVLQELLIECQCQYLKTVQEKTSVFEHQDGKWKRSTVRDIRHISTVVLGEKVKSHLLKDIGEFLDLGTQRWYSSRGIPYRRGYLLYGPPGTGKSSLSLSIAGHFDLDIYILSLSGINEDCLKTLFAELPRRCIILLEDIDAASPSRSQDTEMNDSCQTMTGSPPQNKATQGMVSLSTLLNVIDGVASQEGRLLIMTTNYIERLDEALIRPGRVDRKVEFRLADEEMMTQLFCVVFKNSVGDVPYPKKLPSSVLLEEDETVERLAKEFAAKVPKLKFSPAEILSFLLEHKRSPGEAIDSVEAWTTRFAEAEVPVETIRESRQRSRAPISTPPSTPDIPSSHPSTIDDAHYKDLSKALVAMRITPVVTPICSCSQTALNSPTLQTLSPPVTFENLEQLFLKVIQARTELPDSTMARKPGKPDTPETKIEVARGSKLEFKEINEVYASIKLWVKPADKSPHSWDKQAYKYKVVESVEPADEVHELDQYVFVIRARIDKDTEEPTFHIDVKSKKLRDILRKVLKGVHGISLREDKPTVEQNLLYHYLPELELHQSKARDEALDEPNDEADEASQYGADDTTSIMHLDLLIDYIKTTYAQTRHSLASQLECNEITFDLLWALFKPGSLVYTTCFGTGKPRCVIFDHGEEKTRLPGEEYYSMKCRYLDFDGKDFGEACIELAIPRFRGTKRISLLEAFPLQHHPNASTVKSDLIKCGQKFVSLMGTHHRYYGGEAFIIKKKEAVRFPVDSRIMIDAAFFRKNNPNYSKLQVTEPADSDWDALLEDTIVIDYEVEVTSILEIEAPLQIKSSSTKLTELKEIDLLICCPTVRGFSFNNKVWAEFAVADITEIEWSDVPFTSLSIPPEQRESIMALAEMHMSDSPDDSFDDFVSGKGRGLVVLLHGPPGVGKTLTAEAVSEHLRRPLYSISAGELQITAADLELQVSNIFEIARQWNALLLLDEADVYLEKRSSQDLVRNGLVSVFLRKMEYCNGVMFLTTNRVEEFDAAIMSRIHLMFKYDNLNTEARKMIWTQFIKIARPTHEPTDISPNNMEYLVQHRFNGRQIKNLVATALAIARKRKSLLCFSHLQYAVEANKKFVTELNGGEEYQRMY